MGLFDRLSKLETRRLPARNEVVSADGEISDQKLAQIRLRTADWTWPLRKVHVTSPFGERGREFHEGVDLRAKTGTSVYAAQSGVVLYAASRIRGYGRMVVIKHPSGLSTVYAHNSRLLVHRGQHVRQGQRIAISGATGHAHGPHVHFEVREGTVAIDPMQLMPTAPSVRNVALQK
jgi:murein DD-endopeptidase MepM/ murein hydrolase activator NlpD